MKSKKDPTRWYEYAFSGALVIAAAGFIGVTTVLLIALQPKTWFSREP